MSKSTTVKLPVHHKKQKGPHAEKVWEGVVEHHLPELATHGKARQHQHFPSRHWGTKQEKNKGRKI